MRLHTWFLPPTALMIAIGATACGTDLIGKVDRGLFGGEPTERPTGATEFVSADAYQGEDSGRAAPGSDEEMTTGQDADGGRTVEEGDIYRVLSGNLIVNLNAYRGLQIIDFSDVQNPQIVGRFKISGHPVEMYVTDDTATILMNNWYAYYAVDSLAADSGDGAIGQWNGGVAVTVDISDPLAPTLIDRAAIPGYISTSRLTRGNGESALYVATSGYAQWNGVDWESRTFVKSFDTSTGALEEKSELDLGGYVTDIHATTEALLVARYNWNASGGGSSVMAIDISDPSGTMLPGADLEVAGYIENQFNLDLRGNILRVVSGANWNGTQTNHLQTFDATDLGALSPIDHVTFGDGENLFATIFLEDRAFFVTYEQVDPFHAFSVDANGYAEQMSEFIVSGWNEFLRPVLDDTRLIGIGFNDEVGQTLSVSLYDITDLTNVSPLMARADIDTNYSWSEAAWDHRAFSVLENAVSATGPNGELETGLVLLPFTGWSDDWESYSAGVQIFTFSDTSLSARDIMEHGTPVRRSFVADADTTANLSEAELSLFDTSTPDAATELGRLELAPNYTDFLVYGDHGVRLKNSRDYYWYWWGDNADLPSATVEVIARAEHADTAEAVASFEIPADAQVHKSGDQLITVTTRYLDTTEWPYTYESELQVWDLSDPTDPQHTGTLVTDQLEPDWYYGWYYWDVACFDCRGYGYGYGGNTNTIESVPGGLVFLQRHPQQELEGHESVCSTYPSEWEECDFTTQLSCTYWSGSIDCRSLDGDPEVCTGDLQECTYSRNGSWDCTTVDPSSIQTETHCYDYDRYRYWNSFTLEVLDVTNPGTPLLTSVAMPDEQEGVGILGEGSDVWVTYKVPYELPGDSRQYTQYFIEAVDVSDPSAPQLGSPINVPGELIALDGDTIFTRDLVWGANIAETSIARLQLNGGLAYLEATRTFADAYVQAMLLDGAGHALVSHSPAWNVNATDYRQRLSVLDADSAGLALLSETVVADWASLRDAQAGRALFQVPGGMLVFDTEDATAPAAQAYFATRGWPQEVVVDDGEVIVPAGRYGIYEFDLGLNNLVDPL